MTSIVLPHSTGTRTSALRNVVRSLTATTNDWTPTAFRILLGVMFLPHGAQKTIGWFGGYGYSGTMGYFASIGIPAVFGFAAIAAESAGALALIAGLGTRFAAAGIAANMIVSALMIHAANGFFINWFGNQKGEGLEYHLFVIAIALMLIVRGGGKASVDARIAERAAE